MLINNAAMMGYARSFTTLDQLYGLQLFSVRCSTCELTDSVLLTQSIG